MRLPDEIGTTSVIECKVRGCGWQAEIPVLYRIEPAHRLPDSPASIVSTRVVVDREAIEAFDAYLAGHLVAHEIVETALEHGDDPGPEVPVDELVEVEPDGWRTP